MTVSTIANTTQQLAYEYVTDLSHHPDWAMDQMTIEPVGAGPVSVGSKFKHAGTEPFLGGRLHRMNVTVTELEPPFRFGFDTEDGRVEARGLQMGTFGCLTHLTEGPKGDSFAVGEGTGPPNG